MKSCFQLLFFLWATGFLAQPISLPIVKLGNWYLLKNGKESALPKSYNYVDVFDAKGLTVFRQGQQYGILDENGKEIIAARYKDIKALGNGFFSCTDDLGNELFSINSSDFKTIRCQQVKVIGGNWIFVADEKNGQYINLLSETSIPEDSNLLFSPVFTYLTVTDQEKQITTLYSKNGQKLFSGKAEVDGYPDYACLISDSFNICFREENEFYFPTGSQNIKGSYEYISYKYKDKSYLLDVNNFQTLFSFPCDRIEPWAGFYEITKNNLKGLVSPQGQVLIPCKYDFFEYDEKYIYASFNTLTGLYNHRFEELLACNYKSLSFTPDFINTTSTNGYVGLVSLKTYKEILPAVYDRIEVKDNKIKARYKGTLNIFEMNDKHQVTEKYILENAISLQSARSIKPAGIDFDTRLLELGWYFSTPTGKELIWGLKNERDSIVVKPKFKNLRYVKNAPFTLMQEELKISQGDPFYKAYLKNRIPRLTLLSNTNARPLPLKLIVEIDSLDFISRDFARFVDTSSFGIIRADNKIERFSYLEMNDFGQDIPLRFCKAKSYTLSKLGTNMSLFPHSFLYPNEDKHKFITYEKATWNYLDKNGDSLFKEPFHFAENFYKTTALVSRDNLWGVIRKDTIIVPIIYNSIERLNVYSDTVFLVGVSHKNDIFLDSSLQVIDTLKSRFEKKTPGFYLLKKKNLFRVYTREDKLVLETEKNIKFHDFKRFVVREKKNFVIYNEKGNVIGDVKNKPEEFISENEFITENTAKKGIISVYDDTLVPVLFQDIELYGDYILASSRQEIRLYSRDFKLIESLEEGKILPDAASGCYAVVKGKKVEVFDASQTRIARFTLKDIELSRFHSKRFFSEKQKNAIYELNGTPITVSSKIMGLQFLDNGYTALQDQEKTWHLYDRQWKKLQLPFQVRKIVAVEDEMYIFRTSGGLTIYNERSQDFSQDYKSAVFNPGYDLMLVERNSGEFRFEFITHDFKNPIKRRFSQASIFENGLAPVADERGWTLIGLDGSQKSYPNFNKLESLGANFYRSTEKKLYGLVDSQGKVLIEAEYEKISVLKNQVIQLIRDGEISYRDLTGKVIYENKR